jgi:hypothetical protein
MKLTYKTLTCFYIPVVSTFTKAMRGLKLLQSAAHTTKVSSKIFEALYKGRGSEYEV